MYIPDKAVNFYRIGFYDNILDADKLSMYIEIGYGKEDEITEQDVEMQLKLTLENLHKLGIIDDDTKLEEHSTLDDYEVSDLKGGGLRTLGTR